MLTLSHVQLFATHWTVAHQAPLSMGFPRQEYWSGVPFPVLEDPAHLGIKPSSPASLTLADTFFTTEPPGKPISNKYYRELVGEGKGTPLQYSCLGNPMDRGAWWGAVHGVAKSRTRLSNFTYEAFRYLVSSQYSTTDQLLKYF